MSTGPQRYASVDALRGITVAAMLLVNHPGDWAHVYAPLLHAPWHGCTPTDLIFPFFLFIVGVSIALGIVPRVEAGADIARLQRTVLIRALKIIGIGLLLHALAWWLLDPPAFRPMGVLQRIGLCFLVVGSLVLRIGARAQWVLIAALLAGYALLLGSGGSYAQGVNLADRFDTATLGPFQYKFDAATGLGQEPEGLLSTLPAIATTLLGVRVGEWLRRGNTRAMLIAAVVALMGGWLWSRGLPLNKSLWTSSYVLWTAGWAMLMLLAAHALVDRRGWPALGRSFGVNAITAYAGAAVLVIVLQATGAWGWLYANLFAAWMTPRFGAYLPSLLFALSYVALWWLIVRWMDKRGWHLKV